MSIVSNKNYLKVTYSGNKSKYPNKFCNHFFKQYSAGSSLLDLGCGNGDFSKEFELMGFNVTSADINNDADKIIDGKTIVFDFEKDKFPFEDNSFDIVFSKSVIEHLRNPDVMMSEVLRVLRPGGTFICMTPSWKHTYKEQFYIDHTHVTPFIKHSLKSALEIVGFDNISCSYLYQLPFLWKNKWYIFVIKFINLFNLPYRPFYDVKWSDRFNKFLRFSKEVMLFSVSKKPKN